MVGVLVAGGGDRTPSQPCRGTLGQGTEPPNAHIGSCDELATLPTCSWIRLHRPPPRNAGTRGGDAEMRPRGPERAAGRVDVEQLGEIRRGQVVTGLKCGFLDGSANREPMELLQGAL